MTQEISAFGLLPSAINIGGYWYQLVAIVTNGLWAIEAYDTDQYQISPSHKWWPMVASKADRRMHATSLWNWKFAYTPLGFIHFAHDPMSFTLR